MDETFQKKERQNTEHQKTVYLERRNQGQNFFVRNGLKIVFALVLILAALMVLVPFLRAVLMGAILALALSPALSWMENQGLKRWVSLSLLVVGLFTVVLAPTLTFFIHGAKVLTTTFNDPAIVEKYQWFLGKFNELVIRYGPSLGLSPEEIQKQMFEGSTQLAKVVLASFSSIVGKVPDMALFSVIMLMAIYFFLDNEKSIRKFFDRYFLFEKKNGDIFIQVLKGCSREVFLINVLSGLLVATVVTVGAAVCQLDEWFLIFFVSFISSFIPMFGAGPIGLLLALYCFALGNNLAGFGMGIVTVITFAVDNLVRPYFSSHGLVKVPGAAAFLAVLGGVLTMGLSGLFIGPLVVSLALGLLPIIFEELF